jgi:hypothetical protein
MPGHGLFAGLVPPPALDLEEPFGPFGRMFVGTLADVLTCRWSTGRVSATVGPVLPFVGAGVMLD